MKPLIAFIAGVLVGWWVKPKCAEPCPNQVEVGDFIGTPDSKGEIHWHKKGVKPCQEQDERPTKLDDTNTWKTEDGWVFDDAGFGMKILGVYDRMLTNDELKRIHGMSADEIEDSFEDTQPIRISSQKEEK